MSIKEKIVTLFQIEKIRYQRKGTKNIIIALTSLIVFVVSSSIVAKYIWPQKIQNRQLFIIKTSIILHTTLQILYFLIYLPGYLNIVPSYQNYRIYKNVNRPWQNNPEWPKQRKKLIFYLFLNFFIAYPTMVIISVVGNGSKYRFQQLPSAFQIAWQLLFVAYVQQTAMYLGHRLFHQNKYLYKFHKIHHEYPQTFSLVTQYFHPFDYILSILIPSGIPFILLQGRAHCFMFFLWQVWKIYISTQSHSSYYFPWTPTRILPFFSDSSYHNYHHSKNIGNYCGNMYLWDYVNNTCAGYFKQYGIDLEKLENKSK